MAGSFSDAVENEVLDHVFGKGAYPMPGTVAAALVTVTPTDASTGATITEADYTGYARKVIAAADLNAASSGTMTNSSDITFDNCTAGSSTIVGAVILDNATIGAGTALAWSDVTSKTIDVNNTPPVIPAGSLTLTLG